MIGLTITAGTHCRRRKSDRGRDERTAKGEDDKRGGERRVTEEVRKERREERWNEEKGESWRQ